MDSTTFPTTRFGLVRLLARGWWLFLLRGVVSILFGILVLWAPSAGLAFILALLAAWMAVDGAMTLYQAIAGPPERHGLWFWVEGILSLVAAAVVLLMPGVSALTLVFLTAFWLLLSGVFRLVMAFRVSSVMLGLFGAIAILLGAWMVMNPGPGLLAVIWMVALEAILAGVLLLGFGWRLRAVHNDPHGPALGRG